MSMRGLCVSDQADSPPMEKALQDTRSALQAIVGIGAVKEFVEEDSSGSGPAAISASFRMRVISA